MIIDKRLFTCLAIVIAAVYGPRGETTENPCEAPLTSMDLPGVEDQFEQLRRDSTGTGQNTQRRLSEYAAAFKQLMPILVSGFGQRDFHWLDSGGGVGLACLESLAGTSVIKEPLKKDQYQAPTTDEEMQRRQQAIRGIRLAEDRSHKVTVITIENLMQTYANYLGDNLERLVATVDQLPAEHICAAKADIRHRMFERDVFKRIYDLAVASGRLAYRPGKPVEAYGDGEIEPADVITDFMGAYSYSDFNFLVLEKYAEWLKPSGLALILAGRTSVLLVDKYGQRRPLALSVFLEHFPVPGVKMLKDGVLLIQRHKGTVAGLRAFRERMALERRIYNVPPYFTYSYQVDKLPAGL